MFADGTGSGKWHEHMHNIRENKVNEAYGNRVGDSTQNDLRTYVIQCNEKYLCWTLCIEKQKPTWRTFAFSEAEVVVFGRTAAVFPRIDFCCSDERIIEHSFFCQLVNYDLML